VPKTRPAYPEEFRARAVELIRSSGKTQREVASELGVSRNALAEWIKRADLDTGRRHDGLTTSEREELRRLRREIKVVTEEREILRKAAAFFAAGEAARTR
jgi:transposase